LVFITVMGPMMPARCLVAVTGGAVGADGQPLDSADTA